MMIEAHADVYTLQGELMDGDITCKEYTKSQDIPRTSVIADSYVATPF